VWSVWVDTVHVYLCRGVVWYRVPGAGAVSLRVPATLALAGQLERVSALLGSAFKEKRVTFRITLGASLCPPVYFDVPEGLNWNDQQWLAQQAATMAWGLNPVDGDKLDCVLSSSQTGLAAALPKTTLDMVHHWGRTSHRATVSSIVPLWAYLSGFDRKHKKLGNAVWVIEPDGVQTPLHALKREAQPDSMGGSFDDSVDFSSCVFSWSDSLATLAQPIHRNWCWTHCFEMRDEK
jgi:hypothetical protein